MELNDSAPCRCSVASSHHAGWLPAGHKKPGTGLLSMTKAAMLLTAHRAWSCPTLEGGYQRGLVGGLEDGVEECGENWDFISRQAEQAWGSLCVACGLISDGVRICVGGKTAEGMC